MAPKQQPHTAAVTETVWMAQGRLLRTASAPDQGLRRPPRQRQVPPAEQRPLSWQPGRLLGLLHTGAVVSLHPTCVAIMCYKLASPC